MFSKSTKCTVALLLIVLLMVNAVPLSVAAISASNNADFIATAEGEATVTLLPGVGAGTMAAQTAGVDVPFTLPANGFSTPLLFHSHSFTGWLVGGASPQAGEVLAAGASIDVDGDITLTAQWGTGVTAPHGMQTFFDSEGIEWRVLAEDDAGNFLIMTERVFGGFTTQSTMAGSFTPYNPTLTYTRLSQSNLRGVLDNWGADNLAPELRAAALTPNNVDNDVRVTTGFGNVVYTENDWNGERRGFTNAGIPVPGLAANGALFVLSISEVNQYFPGPVLHPGIQGSPVNAERIAFCGIFTDTNVARWWWLRSPSHSGGNNQHVIVFDRGNFADVNGPNNRPGFRPALWVGLQTITFDPGAGTGAMEPVRVTPDTLFTLPSSGFTAPTTPPGRTFAGWLVSGNSPQAGDTLSPGDTIDITGNVTLTAQWTAGAWPTHTIDFAPGLGTGTMSSVQVTETEAGATFTLPDSTFTAPTAPPGRTFTGWLVSGASPQAGDTLTPGDTIDITGNVTLTAQWTAGEWPTYTIDFDPGLGTGAMPSVQVTETETGATFTLPDSTFTPPTTPPGRAFAGWLVSGASPQAGDTLMPGDTIDITGNVTLTAQWAAGEWPTYTIDFDPGIGTGTMSSVQVTDTETGVTFTLIDSTFIAPTTPPGSIFAGWLVSGYSPQAGQTLAPDGVIYIAITGNVTLTAQWTEGEWPTHTIEFAPGLGSGTMPSQQVTETELGATFTLIDSTFTAPVAPPERDFVGWLVYGGSPQAGQTLAVGDTIMVTGNVVLIAQWSGETDEPVYFTVTFAPGISGTLVGGTPNVVMVVPYGTLLSAENIPGVIPNTGWAHNGWLAVEPNGFVVVTDITFTAIYTTIVVLPGPDPIPPIITPPVIIPPTPESSLPGSQLPPSTSPYIPWQPRDPVYVAFTPPTIEPEYYEVYDEVYVDPILIPVAPMPVNPIHHAFMIGFAEDGTIRPQANITRAEVATIFFRLITDQHRANIWSQHSSFDDVAPGRWFNNPISTMENGGLFAGIPFASSGLFAPNQAATRAEFAAMVVNYLGLGHYRITDGHAFSDIDDHWAANAINVAFMQGWVTGYTDGTFRPDAQITRAEVAALINRALGRLPETSEDLLPNMLTWPDNQNQGAWYYLYIQEATNSNLHEMKADGIHKRWTQIIAPRNWSSLERPYSQPWDILN